MLAVRLPESIEKQLEKLAKRTGRTKSFYVREAILQHLEELEDLYLVENTRDRIRSGVEPTIPRISSSGTSTTLTGAVGRPSLPASLVPSSSFTRILRCCGLFWNFTT
jgi:RHH-type rel operon transcriptional repressor/antitoxin RelB